MNSIRKKLSLLPRFCALSLTCVFLSASPSTIFNEDFKNGSNEAGWTFGSDPIIVDEPGSSKTYLELDTFPSGAWAPIVQTSNSQSVFLGNYRDKKVTQLAAEVKWFDKYFRFPEDDRPLAVALIHDNFAAVKLSSAPLSSAVNTWFNFEFEIPTSYDDLKSTGWKVFNWPETAVEEDDSHFEEILQDVQQVKFFYADPARVYLILNFQVGITNISLTSVDTE